MGVMATTRLSTAAVVHVVQPRWTNSGVHNYYVTALLWLGLTFSVIRALTALDKSNTVDHKVFFALCNIWAYPEDAKPYLGGTETAVAPSQW